MSTTTPFKLWNNTVVKISKDFYGNVQSPAAKKQMPQRRRATHIYHIDYDLGLRSMQLSIPLTVQQQNLMDKMPVSLIQ